MSMNLASDYIHIPFQIGSWDTYLILSYDEEGKSDGGWRGVARRLELYYQGKYQEEFNRAGAKAMNAGWSGGDYERALQEQQWVKEEWEEHLKNLRDDVKRAINDDITPEFFAE